MNQDKRSFDVNGIVTVYYDIYERLFIDVIINSIYHYVNKNQCNNGAFKLFINKLTVTKNNNKVLDELLLIIIYVVNSNRKKDVLRKDIETVTNYVINLYIESLNVSLDNLVNKPSVYEVYIGNQSKISYSQLLKKAEEMSPQQYQQLAMQQHMMQQHMMQQQAMQSMGQGTNIMPSNMGAAPMYMSPGYPNPNNPGGYAAVQNMQAMQNMVGMQQMPSQSVMNNMRGDAGSAGISPETQKITYQQNSIGQSFHTPPDVYSNKPQVEAVPVVTVPPLDILTCNNGAEADYSTSQAIVYGQNIVSDNAAFKRFIKSALDIVLVDDVSKTADDDRCFITPCNDLVFSVTVKNTRNVEEFKKLTMQPIHLFVRNIKSAFSRIKNDNYLNDTTTEYIRVISRLDNCITIEVNKYLLSNFNIQIDSIVEDLDELKKFFENKDPSIADKWANFVNTLFNVNVIEEDEACYLSLDLLVYKCTLPITFIESKYNIKDKAEVNKSVTPTFYNLVKSLLADEGNYAARYIEFSCGTRLTVEHAVIGNDEKFIVFRK